MNTLSLWSNRALCSSRRRVIQIPASHRVLVCRSGWPRPGAPVHNNKKTVYRVKGYILHFHLVLNLSDLAISYNIHY